MTAPVTAEPPGPALDGAVLFSRYAYPPNALGYCGPADPAALLAAVAAPGERGAVEELRARALQFEGAWPYLQLIAGCNHVADPLDPRVVQAYWVGNDLLTRVSPSALLSSLDDRFARRAGTRFSALAAAVPLGAVVHHNFHVFGVSPWLGLLRSGRDGPPLEVLERCRIRWGRVVGVSGDRVTVRSRALAFDGHRLALGPERLEEAWAGRDGVGPLSHLSAGDVVSLHWDWVCDRLSPAELRSLADCTRRNLAAVNAAPDPGPARAVGV